MLCERCCGGLHWFCSEAYSGLRMEGVPDGPYVCKVRAARRSPCL